MTKGDLLQRIPQLKEALAGQEKGLFYYNLTAESYHVLMRFAQIPEWISFYFQPVIRYMRGIKGMAADMYLPLRYLDLSLIGCIGILFLLWRRREKEVDNKDSILPGLRRTYPLILFSVVLVFAYIWKVSAFWFFPRYFAPIFYVIIIYLSVSLFIAFNLMVPKNGRIRSVLAVAVVSSFLFFFFKTGPIYTRGFGSVYSEVIPHIQNTYRPTDKFGAFQSGLFGYFLDVTVVNLDGVVNPEAFAYTEQGQIREYIMKEEIDFIVDWDVLIVSALGSPPKVESDLIPVARFPRCMMTIYKVNQPHERP
jgi:hypothetical protein